jgi:sigma-B regulation protein RsbU (phosphoserine phosphatase)
MPTATILGAFRHWECAIGQIQLARDDLLLLFTDGLTECRNKLDEEYGESGLLASLREKWKAPLPRVLDAIATANRRFRDGPRQDDVTVVAVRAREKR